MSHGSGLYVVPNIAAGCTHLIPASRGFDVHEIDTLLAFATGMKFFAAPTMLMRLVDGMRGEAKALKSIIYGGGPMYVSDALRALERLGPRLTQIYGQGESPMTISVLSAEEHIDNHDEQQLIRLASVGRAQTGVEIQVVDETDRALPTGDVGEVCVRSDAVMLGYLNDPEASAKTLARGWLHTGDMGRLERRRTRSALPGTPGALQAAEALRVCGRPAKKRGGQGAQARTARPSRQAVIAIAEVAVNWRQTVSPLRSFSARRAMSDASWRPRSARIARRANCACPDAGHVRDAASR
jgi:acyl-CoA synthetase (AMP-forming)/AMP-acid ligase II